MVSYCKRSKGAPTGRGLALPATRQFPTLAIRVIVKRRPNFILFNVLLPVSEFT